MKKIMQVLVFVLILFVIQSGCQQKKSIPVNPPPGEKISDGSKENAAVTPAKTGIKVGVILSSDDEIKSRLIKKVFESAFNKEGVEMLFLSENKIEKQVEGSEKLINQGISVLIVQPADPFKAEEIVKKCRDKKVKVISFARIIRKVPIDLAVVPDYRQGGELLTRATIDKAGKNSNILFLQNYSKTLNETDFVIGSAMEMRKYPGVVKNKSYEKPGSTPEKPSEILEAVLKTKKPDAIICSSDKIADEALMTLKKHKLVGKIWLGGIGAHTKNLRYVYLKEQTFDVAPHYKDLLDKVVRAAITLARDEELKDTDIEKITNGGMTLTMIKTKMELVTSENLSEIVKSSSVYSEEEILKPSDVKKEEASTEKTEPGKKTPEPVKTKEIKSPEEVNPKASPTITPPVTPEKPKKIVKTPKKKPSQVVKKKNPVKPPASPKPVYSPAVLASPKPVIQDSPALPGTGEEKKDIPLPNNKPGVSSSPEPDRYLDRPINPDVDTTKPGSVR